MHLTKMEDIIAACEHDCSKILEYVDSDVLGVETERFSEANQTTRSTVGLMVTDCIVDNTLTGTRQGLSASVLLPNSEREEIAGK